MTGSVGLVTVRAPAPRGPNALPATPRPRRSSPFPPPAACARDTRAGAALCTSTTMSARSRESSGSFNSRTLSSPKGCGTQERCVDDKLGPWSRRSLCLPPLDSVARCTRTVPTRSNGTVTFGYRRQRGPGRHDSTDDLGWDEHHQRLVLSRTLMQAQPLRRRDSWRRGGSSRNRPRRRGTGRVASHCPGLKMPRAQGLTRAVGPRLCPPKSLPGRSDACR